MNVKSLVIGGAAVGTLVVLGVLSSNSPEFKYHATTVLIVLLGLLSLGAIIVSLVLRLLDNSPAERASVARSTTRRGHYTGARR
ncbi:hypothetical protein [Pseudonocardia alaniniphila]|uniref:Uncharacterized protein n=1 Tax=Pseudonocardia alaniniphila TaxID=75291 RepID=A0ABS9TRY7_9PSEU|nr:hypothetical protein [Pseudonocardia alaniniphila]MCH6171271.1 hypothetical protein [Pseudonocardia alaniniphila]